MTFGKIDYWKIIIKSVIGTLILVGLIDLGAVLVINKLYIGYLPYGCSTLIIYFILIDYLILKEKKPERRKTKHGKSK